MIIPFMDEDVTEMLQAMHAKEPGAADRLMDAVYDELRRVSRCKMAGEFNYRTLQATALVNEAWLRMGGDDQTTWQNRRHFFSAAAESMRRILIERARKKKRIRHGGVKVRVDIDEVDIPEQATTADNLAFIGEAVERLSLEAPKHAELVKLRFFAGLNMEEASELLGITSRTARNWWKFSKAWLKREIKI